jgi:hypothetical protein
VIGLCFVGFETGPVMSIAFCSSTRRPHLVVADDITHLWRRLQRWIRTLRERRQRRALAFAMGSHGRLGENSAVLGLVPELMAMII